MVTREEWRKAFGRMRSVAIKALELADGCHGGHSWESFRSAAAGVCCEAKMEVTELKARLVKLADGMEVRELPQRRKR